MKKLLFVFLGCLFLTILTAVPVRAEIFGSFTVEKLTYSNGSIKSEVLYTISGLNNAIAKMDSLPQTDSSGNPIQYAVKYSGSKSQMKIVATNRGYAHTYPEHTGQDTLYITDAYGGFVSYSWTGRLMQYEKTTEIQVSGSTRNVVKVKLNGASGYVNLDQVDIFPLIYIENGVAVTFGKGKGYSEVLKPPTYTSRTSDGIKEIMFRHEDLSYYSPYGFAPSWMEDGMTYYSFDGIYFYYDLALTKIANPDDPYYSYYQFLPARSKSKITSAQLDSYTNSVVSGESRMVNQGRSFVHYGQVYDMNALLIYALGAHESAFGQSYIALAKNNIFGWGAYDSSPYDGANSYNSVANSIKMQMSDNLDGYLNINDWRFMGPSFGNKATGFNVRYASDPYWSQMIAQIAYAIDKQYGFQDYNAYQLGLLTGNQDVLVYQNPSASASVLEKRRSDSISTRVNVVHSIYSTNLTNQTVIIHKNEDAEAAGFYEVYLYAPGLSDLDWDTGFGYIPQSQVTLINDGEYYVPNAEVTEPSPGNHTTPNDKPENYKVTVELLNIRNSDSINSSIIGGLSKDQVVNGIKLASNWLMFKVDSLSDYTKGSKIGYASLQFMEKVTTPTPTPPPQPQPDPTPPPQPPVEEKTYESLFSDIRVRDKDSTSGSTILGYLAKGQKIKALLSNGWLKFSYNGKIGYVVFASPADGTPWFKEVVDTPQPIDPTPVPESRLGDVNEDGVIDIFDNGMIIRHILGRELIK